MSPRSSLTLFRQDALNKQLSKLPLIPVKRDIPFEIFGTPITAHVNVTLGPPQVKVKDGSDANQTNYNLILDLESKDIIVNIDLNIDIPSLTGMQTMLKLLIQQDIGNGKDYKVATFSLAKKQAEQLQPLIPVYADFSLVQDRDTSNKSKGDVYFNHPVLPPNENFMVLVSNKLLLEQYILPQVVSSIKGKAKSPNDVANNITLNQISGSELYRISNKYDLNLSMDHNPWVHSFTAEINTSEQALYFDVDVQADVTFLDIHVEATDKIWHQFEITGGDKIGLKKIKEEQNQSQWMEWWKWLLAACYTEVQPGNSIIFTL
ncbi:hypothetical protein B0T24DRAFT_670866 [Lasiosphaeria ovina]|uniref:Uncharacterized protein n=1 Tax=Lasiosphaeria ovina TaxID=92902 RepID=A0AAE0JU74_9PEZI|nr:hypothetical protein B0T24DRAFT_670866 [Lasiosphaeria ovina]